ncbi:unnamed protein product [Bemisia tabaci]|uniref:Uncharacterized protein n=1 Tax=Bemisia tabaci TaxID=7038 RepID=A0A9P0CDN0_BEMTA|nr:unnamed protein product [Bemisia tabaci]
MYISSSSLKEKYIPKTLCSDGIRSDIFPVHPQSNIKRRTEKKLLLRFWSVSHKQLFKLLSSSLCLLVHLKAKCIGQKRPCRQLVHFHTLFLFKNYWWV